ncbi:MAG: tetratricopeptide repeat protein [Bryobacterales bacterium]|nr:tetratricopeptide repeat protein [Bryobacterales bacterium]
MRCTVRLSVALALVFVLAFPALSQTTFRALTISGVVKMEDGQAPPNPALIVLWCDGRREPQFNTNRNGKFSFRLGADPAAMAPDSRSQLPSRQIGATGPDRSYVNLQNCEVEAVLAGYSSSRIQLGRRSVFESSDIGVIILHPLAKGEGSFISVNSAAAPDNARQLFEKAGQEMKKPRPDTGKAIKQLTKAVAAYPAYAEAWNLLGRAQALNTDYSSARESFEKAATADPKFVSPMLALALLEMQQRHFKECADWAAKTLKLLPALGEANYYMAISQMSLGNPGAAEGPARAAAASPDATEFPKAHFILGNVLAQRGDIKAAAAEFRKYVELEPNSAAAQATKKQLAEWEAAGALK